MTVLLRRRTVNVAVAGTVTIGGAPVFQSTPVSLGDVMLHRWIVRIPNGHAGLTGVALQVNGVTIVPFDNPANPFVFGNDSLFEFEIGTEVGNGLVILQTNSDLFTHTHLTQFEYTPIAAANRTVLGAVAPVAIA